MDPVVDNKFADRPLDAARFFICGDQCPQSSSLGVSWAGWTENTRAVFPIPEGIGLVLFFFVSTKHRRGKSRPPHREQVAMIYLAACRHRIQSELKNEEATLFPEVCRHQLLS